MSTENATECLCIYCAVVPPSLCVSVAQCSVLLPFLSSSLPGFFLPLFVETTYTNITQNMGNIRVLHHFNDFLEALLRATTQIPQAHRRANAVLDILQAIATRLYLSNLLRHGYQQ
jgi:hypothetical protein